MDEQDKVLLETYMRGFGDELDGNVDAPILNPLFLRAYDLGRQHAIIGDDVRSIDYLTNEEIINMIHNLNKSQ